MIATAEQRYTARRVAHLPPAERAPTFYWPRGKPRPSDDRIAEIPYAVAEVNHGRWVVACPLDDPDTGGHCGGAQLAARTDHRYLCVTCGNAEVGGQWLRVLWPTPQLVGRIEALLLKRANLTNRNWQAHETVADLHAQNVAHAVVS